MKIIKLFLIICIIALIALIPSVPYIESYIESKIDSHLSKSKPITLVDVGVTSCTLILGEKETTVTLGFQEDSSYLPIEISAYLFFDGAACLTVEDQYVRFKIKGLAPAPNNSGCGNRFRLTRASDIEGLLTIIETEVVDEIIKEQLTFDMCDLNS